MQVPSDDRPSTPGDSFEAINWREVLTAGAALGWSPRDIFRATLPELLLAIVGWRQARGIKPVQQPMSYERLNELHERYGR